MNVLPKSPLTKKALLQIYHSFPRSRTTFGESISLVLASNSSFHLQLTTASILRRYRMRFAAACQCCSFRVTIMCHFQRSRELILGVPTKTTSFPRSGKGDISGTFATRSFRYIAACLALSLLLTCQFSSPFYARAARVPSVSASLS